MSALPAEVPPSGAVPAATDTRPRGRSRTGSAQARPSVHPLFPSKRWVLPDGDCIFPGGGDRFSGQDTPPAQAQQPAQAPRPADAQRRPDPQRRPDAQRPSRPRAGIRVLARPAGRKAGRVAGGGYIAPAAISQAPPATQAPPLASPITPARRAAGTAAPRRPRLTRRGRIVVAILAALAVCGLFVAGASAAQASGPASAHGNATQVIVQPGDTLWSIAQSADPNADARAIVQQILQANRLTNPDITAGQRLWVPRG